MKVQVKDKQGIDEAGNKHPAPGIEDGTHECELKWQVFSWLSGGDWKDFDVNKYGDPKAFNMQTRQVWVLAEQEKEELPPHYQSPVGAILYKNITSEFSSVGYELENIAKAMQQYADQQTTLKSTRIAELEARVAELEGVLKEIAQSSEPGSYERAIIDMKSLATNALKK